MKDNIITTSKVAIIIENECIGCTKCIRACPIDAILGAAKHMHTVIYDECTGCELCIASCPVNCITMAPLQRPRSALDSAQQRLNFRNFRLERDKIEKTKKQETIKTRKATIHAALLRAKEKSFQRNGKSKNE